MLVSGLIIGLYFWVFFIGADKLSDTLLVSDPAVVAAGSAFLLGTISYLWLPRRYIFVTSYALFVLLVATTGLLLWSSGVATSPFVVLWVLLAVFAPVFRLYGSSIIIATAVGYITYSYLGGQLSPDDLVTIGSMTVLPLVTGYVVWSSRSQTHDETEEDRSYKELASALSTVSGQSEVVIAAIADGVISINAKGSIQLINPAAQRMIGWDKSDALGLDYRSVLKMVDGRDQPLTNTTDPIQKALDSNLITTVDNLSITTNDTAKKFAAKITVSPIGTAGSGLIIVFRDITNERSEEREQAEFISTASHEMRTPVASIEGYLGLALNPATATIDAKAREFITKAQDAAQHLGRLFQDLLDVSKADDGRLSNNPSVIDMVAFIGDIVQGQSQKATDKGLQLVFKPAPSEAAGNLELNNRVISPVYYTKVDRDHLREIVNNLVENAIKYTLRGNVEVDIKGDENSVTISITDSGIGIPQEDIPHLFQKFYRVDNSDTREIGGTGLGLYLCRKLVEAIGGSIWVESTYKAGSTFFIKLPRLDTVAARHDIEAAGDIALVEQPTPATVPSPDSPPDTAPPIIQTSVQPQIILQPTPQPISPPSITMPTPGVSPPTPVISSAPSVNISQPLIAPAPPPTPPIAPPPTAQPTAPVFRPSERLNVPPPRALASKPVKYISTDEKH